MRKTIGALVLVAAAVGVTVYFLGLPARAESPFAGRWQVSLLQGPNQGTFWLIQVEEKAGKASSAKVVFGAGAAFRDTKLKDFKADDKTMSFTLDAAPGEFEVVVHSPRGESKTLLGTVHFRNIVLPLRLGPTDAKEIALADAEKQLDGTKDLQEAAEKGGAAAVKAVRAFLDKNGDKPIALHASSVLVKLLLEEKAKGEDLRAAVDRLAREAGAYGPELERGALVEMTGQLLDHKENALAVEYARKAEKLLGEDARPEERLNVLEALATSLKKAGKEKEARELEPRIAKLNDTLDEAFVKENIPFKPRKFGGRAGKGQHVATVELFTGAQCPPCVAADVAFDAALETYRPRDVVFLQYHLHIPGPDLLASPATEKRAEYYEVGSTPHIFVDGREAPPLGGPRSNGEGAYNTLRKTINRAVDAADKAAVSVKATRKGDKIAITAEVSELKNPGAKVHLRLLLVEEVVRYPGSNGQRLHHHVVRAMPGGAEGFALKEKTAKHSVTVSLAEVRKEQEKYLKEYRFGFRAKPFAETDNLRVTLKDLKVVALVQDDESKEILQAAQVDVPEAK
jgi:hypothetical protein